MKNSPLSLETIDQYITTFPKDIQEILQELRKKIKEVIPESEETIRYGIPTFRQFGKNIVHFGGYKTHIGFYPAPNGIKAFEKELAPYIAGKGTAQFPLDKTIPYDLVQKIVQFRLEEVREK